MSEKFHLFKKPNIVFKVLAVVSLLFIVFYIVDYFQTKEFKTTSFTGVFLQTLIFFLMVSLNNRKNNYYIEFFKDEIILNYLKYKKMRIAFEDIEDIKVKMFEVELTLKNEEKPVLINLDNALDDVVKGVKERFKEIAEK